MCIKSPSPEVIEEESQSKFKDTSLENQELQNSDKSYICMLLESLRNVSYKYQYLDHPADVILLGEGKSIKEALQSISVSLFNYMSDLSYINVTHHINIEVNGKGLINFLYHFLDECLYLYSSEYFIAKHIFIEDDLEFPFTLSSDEFNNYHIKVRAVALGENYNKNRHKCGTEIKAITMHYLNFNIWIGDNCYEYKNDMESQGRTEELLKALQETNGNITMCKVYALVDI